MILLPKGSALKISGVTTISYQISARGIEIEYPQYLTVISSILSM